MGRLVILSGPSCVGKGPLHAAWKKFYSERARRCPKFVLYDSRAPRPGEVDGVDYHFRRRDQIDALRGRDEYLVFEVRGDLQALEIPALERRLSTSDVFFEGNPHIAATLMDFAAERQIASLSLFLSPLARAEILELKARQPDVCLADFITDVMRRKLLRRTARQKGVLSLPDLENIETRARSACDEMKQAWRFDHVIANHDGEDSEHWDAFYHPIGDARITLQAFATLLDGEVSSHAERWEQDLIP